MERIGVYVCSGCGIGDSLDMGKLTQLASAAGAAVVAQDAQLCAPSATAAIREAVQGGRVDGVVLAGCSLRHKRDAFRFDGTRVHTERVSLREQCTWSHPPNHEDTQRLAEDLLRMGIARAKKARDAVRVEASVEQAVLVVGGGLTGLTAARAVVGLGHPVVLVEKAAELGGHLARVPALLPRHPPYERLEPSPVPELIQSVLADGRIRCLLSSQVLRISGKPGRFAVEVRGADGATQSFAVGAVVQATGARPYDARKLVALGAGAPDVVTSVQLDEMLVRGELQRPSDGRAPGRIVFIQCAGSRDAAHLAYCSSECCGTSLRQVQALHERWPQVECILFYRDVRAGGHAELFYRSVQERTGVMLARGSVEGVTPVDGRLRVRAADTLLGERMELDADLVVLATGMVPNAADGEAIRQLRDAKKRIERNESETQRTAAEAIAKALVAHEGTEILNLEYRQGPDLPAQSDGFPDSHFICFPYETRRTGIYVAGASRAPMDAAQAEEDAWGAAMKAVQAVRVLGRGEAVHPRSGDIALADFFLQRCTQCKRCTEECPFGTLDEDVKGTPLYNDNRCRRCGICLGACPERIISFADYSVDAVASAIKEIDVPEEFDEKPRILALLCENDAYPALDDAAARRTSWNSWVRVIPVRCLGSVNVVWVNEALSRGIDGVILIGCKSGSDAQCHFIKGSELAQRRLGNMQETLTRLSLEAARLKVVELGRDEMGRIPAVLDAFAQELEALGPSPLKGF